MTANRECTIRLTERELWFLSENFNAAFTDPDERNDHEKAVAEKLDRASRAMHRSKSK